MTSERLLPLAAMEQLLKKAGAHRVSEDAKKALKEVLEIHAAKLCSRALQLSEHAGRRTIQAGDIRLASSE